VYYVDKNNHCDQPYCVARGWKRCRRHFSGCCGAKSWGTEVQKPASNILDLHPLHHSVYLHIVISVNELAHIHLRSQKSAEYGYVGVMSSSWFYASESSAVLCKAHRFARPTAART
jgi:hypothetical protein